MKRVLYNNLVKKKYLNLLVLLLLTQFIWGQNCLNNSSTDPLNPTNEDELFNNYSNPWLNTFDIGKNNGLSFRLIKLNPTAGWDDSGLSTSDTLKMFNPFDIGASPNALYLSTPADSMLNRDWHWEDGWELLYLGTGFYPDGNPVNSIVPNSPIDESQPVLNGKVPYMIYYNRYKGIIRVFAGIFVPFGSAQNVTVDIGLNASIDPLNPLPYNGLLRHLNSYDSPLDQATTVNTQRGVNSAVDFNIRKWYSYDFQVGYDPCSCANQSVLDFTLSTVQSSNVSLYGRMISVEEPLTDANGNPTYDQDFLTATSINDQDPNGYVLKSSLDSLIGDYQENLKTYKQQMEDREFGKLGWIGDMLDKSKDVILGNATNLIPAGNIANWFIEKKLCTAWKWYIDVDTANTDTAKVKKFITSSSKGALGMGFDFLSSQFFGEKPVRPTRPIATFSEMRFSGEINTTNNTVLQAFNTPGSNFSTSGLTAFNYPAYNEVLGLYATLRTPQVQYWATEAPVVETHSSVVEVDSSDYDDNFSPDYTRIDSTVHKSKTIHQEIYLKLKEPIQYALNKALDFDTTQTNINVSFQIVLENAHTFPNTYANRIDSTVNVISDSTNLWSLHDINQSTAPQHDSKRRVELVSGWSNVQDAANLLYGSLFSSTIYYSELFEKDYTEGGENWWNPFQNEFNQEVPIITEETIKYLPVKITMKIMADMFFDQLSFSEEQINTTQIFTYLIYDEAAEVDLIGDQGNYLTDTEANNFLDGFVQMFPGVLTIQSDIITHQSPEIIWPNNLFDLLLVRAEQVIIDKIVEGPPGDPSTNLVTIAAHDNIRLLPGAHIKPSIHLKIDNSSYGISESHAATETELTQFCSSNNYNAGTFVPSFPIKPTNTNEVTAKSESSLPSEGSNTVSIHPNPSNSQIWITSSSQTISEIQIFDLSGRSLIQQKPGNDILQVQIDINQLQSGVYIVQTVCGDERSSEKLVVQK